MKRFLAVAAVGLFSMTPSTASAFRMGIEPFFKYDSAGEVEVHTERPENQRDYTREVEGDVWKLGTKLIIPVRPGWQFRPEFEFGEASSREVWGKGELMKETRPIWAIKIAFQVWVGEKEKDGD